MDDTINNAQYINVKKCNPKKMFDRWKIIKR